MTLIGTKGLQTGTGACFFAPLTFMNTAACLRYAMFRRMRVSDWRNPTVCACSCREGNSLFSYCRYYGQGYSNSRVALTLSYTSEVRFPAAVLLLITGNEDVRIWNLQCHKVRTNFRWHPFCGSRVRTYLSVGTHSKERVTDLLRSESLCVWAPWSIQYKLS